MENNQAVDEFRYIVQDMPEELLNELYRLVGYNVMDILLSAVTEHDIQSADKEMIEFHNHAVGHNLTVAQVKELFIKEVMGRIVTDDTSQPLVKLIFSSIQMLMQQGKFEESRLVGANANLRTRLK